MSLNALSPEEVFKKIFDALAISEYEMQMETLHSAVSNTSNAVFTLYYNWGDPFMNYIDLRISPRSTRMTLNNFFVQIRIETGELDLNAVRENYSYVVNTYSSITGCRT